MVPNTQESSSTITVATETQSASRKKRKHQHTEDLKHSSFQSPNNMNHAQAVKKVRASPVPIEMQNLNNLPATSFPSSLPALESVSASKSDKPPRHKAGKHKSHKKQKKKKGKYEKDKKEKEKVGLPFERVVMYDSTTTGSFHRDYQLFLQLCISFLPDGTRS